MKNINLLLLITKYIIIIQKNNDFEENKYKNKEEEKIIIERNGSNETIETNSIETTSTSSKSWADIVDDEDNKQKIKKQKEEKDKNKNKNKSLNLDQNNNISKINSKIVRLETLCSLIGFSFNYKIFNNKSEIILTNVVNK